MERLLEEVKVPGVGMWAGQREAGHCGREERHTDSLIC